MEDIINHIVALTKFTEQTLNDSHQANSLPNSEVSMMRKVALQNEGVQFSSVAQLFPTLCDPMSPSMPGLPVHHQLPEFTQTQRPSTQ